MGTLDDMITEAKQPRQSKKKAMPQETILGYIVVRETPYSLLVCKTPVSHSVSAGVVPLREAQLTLNHLKEHNPKESYYLAKVIRA